MIALLIASFYTCFLVYTFGLFFEKRLNFSLNGIERFFLGMISITSVLGFISLFFSLNFQVFAVFLIFSLYAWFLEGGSYFDKTNLSLKNWKFLMGVLFLALLALAISSYYPNHFDSGLYHVQSIKWINEYKVVPGLGNIHGRFGFNPSIFLLTALTSWGDWLKQELYTINFLTFLVMMIYLGKLFLMENKGEKLSLWSLFLLLSGIIMIRAKGLSTPSPDFIFIALSFFVFIRFLELIRKGHKIKTGTYLVLIWSIAFILTVKLSAIPLAILGIMLWYQFSKQESYNFLKLFLGGIIILLPWLIRNVIITGWLVYPFPALDLFSFDWKIPLEDVIIEKKIITGFARTFISGEELVAADLSLRDWFPLWWNRIGLLQKAVFSLSLIAPVFLMLKYILSSKRKDFYGPKFNLFGICFTAFAGVLFWLIMAPNWRFGVPFLIFAAASPLWWKEYYFKLSIPRFSFYLILFFILGFTNRKELGQVLDDVVNKDRLYWPQKLPIPSNFKLASYRVGSVRVYYPEQGDRCMDYPLPCTNFELDDLVLRGKGIENGFKRKSP